MAASKLITPYTHLGEDSCIRLASLVSSEDRSFFKSVCPVYGALEYFIDCALFNLVKQLKTDGITYYSPEHSNEILRRIQGCSFARPDSDGAKSNDRRSAKRVHNSAKATANLPAHDAK